VVEAVELIEAEMPNKSAELPFAAEQHAEMMQEAGAVADKHRGRSIEAPLHM